MSDIRERLEQHRRSQILVDAKNEIRRLDEIINKIMSFVEHRYQTRTAKEIRDYIKTAVSDSQGVEAAVCDECQKVIYSATDPCTCADSIDPDA